MILAANIGVAMSVLAQPDRYSDPRLSERVRDAVFAACLTRGERHAERHLGHARLSHAASTTSNPYALPPRWGARLGPSPEGTQPSVRRCGQP